MAAKKSKAAEAETPAPVEIMAFKGFDKDLKCRGFQYEVGKTYEHTGPVVACKSGFHACTDPWDVLKYYDLSDGNRFATVTARGDISREGGGDSKISTASLTVTAELKMRQFIGALVNWIIDATKGKGDNQSGDNAQIGSSGYYAQIKSEGANGVIASAGVAAVAQGAVGTWISLAEFDGGVCVGFATGRIGQDGLLPGVDYIARGGKLVAA